MYDGERMLRVMTPPIPCLANKWTTFQWPSDWTATTGITLLNRYPQITTVAVMKVGKTTWKQVVRGAPSQSDIQINAGDLVSIWPTSDVVVWMVFPNPGVTGLGMSLEIPSEVELGQEVALTGWLVGFNDLRQQVPLANKTLRVFEGDQTLASAVTDTNGKFSVTLSFTTSGEHQLKFRYNAAGLTGILPPGTPEDNDFMMRVCQNPRAEYHIMVASGGQWSVTDQLALCQDQATKPEPYICWDGDVWGHPCPPGSDSTYVARAFCLQDRWVISGGQCQMPRCMPDWTSFEGFYYPAGNWDYGSYVPSGIQPPRPTPADLSLTKTTVPLPFIGKIYYATMALRLAQYGNLYAFGYREYIPPAGNPRYWVTLMGDRFEHIEVPASLNTIFPEVMAMTPDKVWAAENVMSSAQGYAQNFTEIDLATKTILNRTLVGQSSKARFVDMTALTNGGVVAVWYDFDRDIAYTARFGFIYKAPDGTVYVKYPVDIAQPGANPSLKGALTEHPADGSVWFLYHRDSEHCLGALRLVPTSNDLQLTYANAQYVPSNDQYEIYGELPFISAISDWTNGRILVGYTASETDRTCVRGTNLDGTLTDYSYWQRLIITSIQSNGARGASIKTGKIHDWRGFPRLLLTSDNKQRFVGVLQQPDPQKKIFLFGPDQYGWEPWTLPIYVADYAANYPDQPRLCSARDAFVYFQPTFSEHITFVKVL